MDDPDFSFIKVSQTAQQNFVVTDPSLPDNPIVYATHGFLNLTGYSLEQVLGRNCRFLQGPETDPRAVAIIRKAIEEGKDTSVCLLNYRVDGTTFWNQFFIAALRDTAGNITNYVGVQCKVSDQYAAMVRKQQEVDEEDAIIKQEEEMTRMLSMTTTRMNNCYEQIFWVNAGTFCCFSYLQLLRDYDLRIKGIIYYLAKVLHTDQINSKCSSPDQTLINYCFQGRS